MNNYLWSNGFKGFQQLRCDAYLWYHDIWTNNEYISMYVVNILVASHKDTGIMEEMQRKWTTDQNGNKLK
jgi:hypothetical protein